MVLVVLELSPNQRYHIKLYCFHLFLGAQAKGFSTILAHFVGSPWFVLIPQFTPNKFGVQHFNRALLALKHKNRLKKLANISIVRYNYLHQGVHEMVVCSFGKITCTEVLLFSYIFTTNVTGSIWIVVTTPTF